MALKVKDRVKLITDRLGDAPNNPIFGGSEGKILGTVIAVGGVGCSTRVAWDNGTKNVYHEEHLKIVRKRRTKRKGVKYIKVCLECQKEIEEDEEQYNVGNKHLCKKCYHKLYGTCIKCEKISLKETGYTNENGHFFCEECYHKLYTTCDECDEEILRTNTREYDGILYCTDCFYNKYAECDECGEVIYRDEVYIYQDRVYCENCYEDKMNRDILDHEYKPEPIFNKQKWENTAYLGIELEIETEDDKEELAEKLLSKYNDNNFFYLKEDGSLTNGFEIVTHPHTLQKHRDRKWREILEWLKKQGANSYDNAHCGLHVHVNRNLMNKLDWHKIAVFFYKCQNNIVNFSKRTSEQIDEWASFCSPKSIYNVSEAYNSGDSRYVAINWDNKDTVEFRIYRGTLDWKRFWASLNFTASLLDYVRETGVAHFTIKDEHRLWEHFVEWTKKDYQFLHKYLKGVK